MIRNETADGKTIFVDNAEDLPQSLMPALQAAMKAGITEFTTPTPEENDQRIDWRVRKWVAVQNGEPVAFLVAYKELAPHFEIIGPAIDLKPAKK